jgi:hypothetical protein
MRSYNLTLPLSTLTFLLFTLATTSSRVLSEAEKIQHILTAYQHIRQPEIWAQWIRNQIDFFEQGTITNSQAFMNTAVVKVNKLCIENDDQSFPGSSSTLQEDIVAMMVSVKRQRPPANPKGKEIRHRNRTQQEQETQVAPFHPTLQVLVCRRCCKIQSGRHQDVEQAYLAFL